ncbi:MAG: hypothetical protein LBM75_04110, partial [Myxococcales bacterium]|nr:hypothetical protein [Myxococcales bacterium]
RARDAPLHIEGSPFEMAAAKDTSEAWLICLRDHSQGPHAREARARLEDADYRAVREATTVRELRAFLGRHPETARRAELEKRLDEFEFQEAKAQGARGLSTYLASNPVGIHRDEVREALFSREAWAFAQMGRFVEARRLAERVIRDDARRALLERIDAAEVDWLTSTLDLDALEALAKARATPGAAPQADPELDRAIAERLKRLESLGKAGLAQLSSTVDPLHYARPVDEMLGVLKSADPRTRWLAADELGWTGDFSAILPLLDEAAKSRFSRVRQLAFDSLTRLFELLPRDTLELTVRARVDALGQRVAQDVGLFIKLGVLRELLGDLDAALIAYESALRLDSGDTFALRRTVELNARMGKSFRAGVLARELAFRARQLAERWTGVDVEGVNPLLLSRTLCGALDDARFAHGHITALPAEALVDLSDDAPKFIAQAEDSVRFIAARLADAEAEARSENRDFPMCADEDGQAARLAEGERVRIEAVAHVAARLDLLRDILLDRLARRDPSAKVRLAAQRALEVSEVRSAP